MSKNRKSDTAHDRAHAALEALKNSLLHQAFSGELWGLVMPSNQPPPSSIILYQTEDGRTRIQCRFKNETIWLTQALIAEVIHQRADAARPLMGLKTTRPSKIIRREDVAVAKNYLTEAELQSLNRIVSL